VPPMIGIGSGMAAECSYGSSPATGAGRICSARMRLEGRKALVTGGASGIGAAIALRLAAEGARVVIGDVNEESAREVANQVDGEASLLDVTEPDSSSAMVEEHGPFAILVNNAGMDEFGFFTQTDPGMWERVIAVNLRGVLACTHAVLPAMQQSGYGRIVSIASEAGRVGSKGSAVYSAAKGGVIAFTKTIARENARFGITANAIAPGPIDTPLLRSATQLGELGERVIETMKSATQLRRLGEPEEVAAAVAFLASDDASYVTGETIGVSGGLGMV
jgi:2-hydroxycyclohexanecarboxyl-CoA dehydrogenase